MCPARMYVEPCGKRVFSDKLQSIAVCERKETVVRQVMRGVERLAKSCGEVIIVTNELFSDGIDYDEGTREYLSALGKSIRKLQRAPTV